MTAHLFYNGVEREVMVMVGSALLIPEGDIASDHVAAATLTPERVMIRLRGRHADVTAVAARLRIELNRDGADHRPADACSVDGRLDLAESPRLLL
ncbi:MAG: hypothetical protein OYI31_06820 [Chloroflexota bacterium]|nr:hypothetical protein [Chloroflexota bacterium]MDE2942080.1 hypothetical protein [Chloroflexota bacterium]MDE3268140.1 hypothetical protein [Chloroflexota bacterium]